MRSVAVGVFALGACSYHPGSFADLHGAFPGTRQTVGCLDVAVGASGDAEAQGPVVAYGFGNRCGHAVTFDLASVRVVARDARGRERALVAYDPRGELRPLPLDALWFGREQIEYVDDDARSVVSLCVDIGGIDASAPRAERWVCTEPRGTR